MNGKRVYTRQDLHADTARVLWPEVQLHFARGALIAVDPELDLVEVATCFANDDSARVESWTRTGMVGPLQTDVARRWSSGTCELWAVVVAPWVLVQENLSTKSVDKSVE